MKITERYEGYKRYFPENKASYGSDTCIISPNVTNGGDWDLRSIVIYEVEKILTSALLFSCR